jgi:hypothetical protein
VVETKFLFQPALDESKSCKQAAEAVASIRRLVGSDFPRNQSGERWLGADAGQPRGGAKSVIYTPREVISRSPEPKRLNRRSAAEKAARDDLSNGVESGAERVVIRHEMPVFRLAATPPRGANHCFSRQILPRGLESPLRLRGDINESAEI